MLKDQHLKKVEVRALRTESQLITLDLQQSTVRHTEERIYSQIERVTDQTQEE